MFDNKIKYLVLINSWTNTINSWNYFKYYKIELYKLKGFNIFKK